MTMPAHLSSPGIEANEAGASRRRIVRIRALLMYPTGANRAVPLPPTHRHHD